VILCLVFFAVLFLGFLAVQFVLRHTNATIPSRVILQRSVFFGGIFQFFLGSTMLCTIVYLPLWFQAIKGTSPVKSGIDTLPMVLGLVVMSIFCGAVVSRVGYYTQFIYLSVVFMSVGAGLLTTLTPSSGHSYWIGYQAILGMGVGMGMQQSNLAVQTCLPDKDVPIGTAVIFFFQTLGGALFMSVGQNTFLSKFISHLGHVPHINPAIIGSTGATAIRLAVPKALLPQVLAAYDYGVTHGPFLVSTITACLSIIGAAGMEWRSVKEKKNRAAAHPPKDIEEGSLKDEPARSPTPAAVESDAADEKSAEAPRSRDGVASNPATEGDLQGAEKKDFA